MGRLYSTNIKKCIHIKKKKNNKEEMGRAYERNLQSFRFMRQILIV